MYILSLFLLDGCDIMGFDRKKIKKGIKKHVRH